MVKKKKKKKKKRKFNIQTEKKINASRLNVSFHSRKNKIVNFNNKKFISLILNFDFLILYLRRKTKKRIISNEMKK